MVILLNGLHENIINLKADIATKDKKINDQATEITGLKADVAAKDKQIGDLVGFLVWAAEPGAGFRKQVGYGVLLFLIVLFGVSYALKKEYWKDVPKN